MALEHLKRTLFEHQTDLKIQPNLPEICVDMSLCEQAIANILLNAAQYTPESTAIEIDLKQVHGEIHISITDGGPGIPEAYLGRVFDKFYRYPGSNGQGAGIGLAVAKGVIRAHGGKIAVANVAGKGACFKVILPMSPAR